MKPAGRRNSNAATIDMIQGGSVNMSAADHLGLDQRARVMVKISGEKWVLDN